MKKILALGLIFQMLIPSPVSHAASQAAIDAADFYLNTTQAVNGIDINTIDNSYIYFVIERCPLAVSEIRFSVVSSTPPGISGPPASLAYPCKNQLPANVTQAMSYDMNFRINRAYWNDPDSTLETHALVFSPKLTSASSYLKMIVHESNTQGKEYLSQAEKCFRMFEAGLVDNFIIIWDTSEIVYMQCK